ncbi:hypothetical protein Fmac_028498 [Flemingia macrophylla]|uniref:Uncharacterized protein n=1 Tax=Flemingia macrophylla TaxID=520843 RepID=A0ABD1L7N8_9FABA
MMSLSLEEFMMWLQIHTSVVATNTSAETRKPEGKLDALVNLVTQLAVNQKSASIVRVCSIRSSNDHHTSACTSSQQSRVDEHPESYAANTYSRPPQGVHDVATDTSAETRKLESILDALVNWVTQLAANQKSASATRVYNIHSSNNHHTSACPSSQQSGPFSARNNVIVIRRVHDVATDTSAEIRKLVGKLDDLLNLVTHLTANQKPASVARVCGIRSSNDHHTTYHHSCRDKELDREDDSQFLAFSARNDAIVIRGVHDVAIDTSAETRKLEGKLDALVNLVTQLAANQKPACVARVCGIRSSKDHHTSTTIAAEARHLIEKMAPNSQQFNARNDAIVIREVQDVATDTSAETRKLEGKIDALVNMMTHLVVNQKPASVARVCGIRSSNDHHTSVFPSTQQPGFSARNDAIIIRGVDDKATDTNAETRKLEGMLDALVNLVTQLSVNQKHASVAMVCDIRSSNDRHTSVCPSSQQSRVDGHPEAYDANTYRRPPQQQRQGTINDAIVIRGVHDVAIDTSAETRKLQGKLNALVNLVTQLDTNQKPTCVARVCGICSSNDHHTSVCPCLKQSRFSARNNAIVIRGVHDVGTDTSAETRKLEGKLDALRNLVTQLAAKQKPANIARVCGIRSSNDHHTSVRPSWQQSGVDEHHEAYATNTYSRSPQ